jgi:trigger factor
MKKRTLLFVMGLCVVMLAGGCSKKGTEKKGTDVKPGVTKGAVKTSKLSSEISVPEREAYEVSDYITLGKYKGVEVTVEKKKVTDKDVEAQIQKDLDQKPNLEEVTDRKVIQDKDYVNIDFKGLIDGKAFQGGTATGYDLEIGSNSFIPGFEKQLIGKKVGDKLDVNVTFPKDYKQSPDLAGKDAVFKVTVNAIKKKNPQITEKYVKANSKFKTVDAYKKNIQKTLEKENKTTMENTKKANVISKIIDNSKIKSVPKTLLNYYNNMFQNQYKQQAQSYGMKLTDFLAQMGATEAQFLEQAKAYGDAWAKQELVLNAIVKAENMKLTDKEYKKGLSKIMTYYGCATEDEFYKKSQKKEAEVKSELTSELLREKATDLVVKSAIVK